MTLNASTIHLFLALVIFSLSLTFGCGERTVVLIDDATEACYRLCECAYEYFECDSIFIAECIRIMPQEWISCISESIMCDEVVHCIIPL